MPAAAPPVRVVIVNFNGGDWLRRCVAALLAQDHAQFEAVVVDNASHDDSLAGLPADARLRVLRLDENLGFAAANNLGAAGFAGRWIATLNPDALPRVDWLSRLLAAAEAHPDAQFFGSTQLSLDGQRYDGTGDGLTIWGCAWRGDLGRPVRAVHPDGEVFAPCAAAALYDRAWFERLGGFDARLFCYLEDIDLALRLRLAGGRCRQVGDALVHHAGSALTGGAFSLFHVYRNQLWLLALHWPLPLLLAALPGHLLWLAAVSAHLARSGRQGPMLAGLAAGLRGWARLWRVRRPAPVGQLARAVSWHPAALLKRRSPVRRDG